MVRFVESSALVKRYVAETGTPWVAALCDPAAQNALYVSDITHVEGVAAIRRRQLGGSISPSAASALMSDLHHDFAAQYLVVALTPALIARAVLLADTHGLRAADALQLAAALDVRDGCRVRQLRMVLVSADGELNVAAKAEGLTVENPNDHP